MKKIINRKCVNACTVLESREILYCWIVAYFKLICYSFLIFSVFLHINRRQCSIKYVALKADQFNFYFIGLKKIPVFKSGQNFFLQVLMLPPLTYDINAIWFHQWRSSLKLKKIITFDWGQLISLNPEKLLGFMDSGIICGCTAPAKG